MPPRLHLGINTCFAAKRWPEPEQWIAVVVRDLGLTCCQLSLDLVDPLLDEAAITAYADEVRRRAAAAGLFVHSTFTGLAAYSWSQLLHPNAAMRAAAQRWYERAIDFTARLGATGTGGHLGAFSVRDAARAERRQMLLEEMAGRLGELTVYAAQRGLHFLLCENMAVLREWGSTIPEAHALTGLAAACGAAAAPPPPDAGVVEQCPQGTMGGVPIVLCLDVCNPCVLQTGTASDDPLAWLAEPWARRPVLHLAQTDRTSEHHWPFTAAYNAVGMIHAGAILDAIRQWQDGSDVYLFLEIIHPFEAADATVLSDVRASVQYWREALEIVGISDQFAHRRTPT